MCVESLCSRMVLSGILFDVRRSVAAVVSEQFIHRFPGWSPPLEAADRSEPCCETSDLLNHLAGAIGAGDNAHFVAYARWRCRMLAARGLPPRYFLEQLNLIERELEQWLGATEQALVMSLLQAGRHVCEPVPWPSLEEQPGELVPIRDAYLEAVLKGDRIQAQRIVLQALEADLSQVRLYEGVLRSALQKVGELWEANLIAVAQEHMASAVTQHILALMSTRLPVPAVRLGRAVITAVEGEQHQIGALMVADLLQADGWEVHFLGADVPGVATLEFIELHRPDLLGISCTMACHLPRAVALIQRLRRPGHSGVPRVLVGGAAFDGAPALRRELEIDGYAPDLFSAVPVARTLCPTGGASQWPETS